jgi:hypothetical protein
MVGMLEVLGLAGMCWRRLVGFGNTVSKKTDSQQVKFCL